MPRGKKTQQEQIDNIEPGFTTQWRNRIVGYGEEAPDQLLANPKNWRMHPDTQAKALQGVLHEVGVVQNIIVNKRTGMLVDGHLRTMLALRSEQKSVPVTYVDLSDEEEAKVLASLDPIAAMAGTDNVQLEALLEEIVTESPGLQNLLDSLKVEVEQTKQGSKKEQETEGRYDSGILALREDSLFASKHPDNVWNIPELHATRGELEGGIAADDPTPLLAQESDLPSDVWGGSGFKQSDSLLYLYGMHKWNDDSARGGMLGFYVYDDKFATVWNDAVAFVKRYMGIFPVMIAPDFSLWRDDPLAVQVWNLYRMYWCARYWQEAGVRVVPNLCNLPQPDPLRYGKLVPPTPWPLWVIPPRPPVVAVQCRATRSDYGRDLFRHTFSAQIEMIQPGHVLLYGGKENRDWVEPLLPAGPEYHWHTSWTAKRLSRRRGVSTSELTYKSGDMMQPVVDKPDETP